MERFFSAIVAFSIHREKAYEALPRRTALPTRGRRPREEVRFLLGFIEQEDGENDTSSQIRMSRMG